MTIVTDQDAVLPVSQAGTITTWAGAGILTDVIITPTRIAAISGDTMITVTSIEATRTQETVKWETTAPTLATVRLKTATIIREEATLTDVIPIQEEVTSTEATPIQEEATSTEAIPIRETVILGTTAARKVIAALAPAVAIMAASTITQEAVAVEDQWATTEAAAADVK